MNKMQREWRVADTVCGRALSQNDLEWLFEAIVISALFFGAVFALSLAGLAALQHIFLATL